MKLLDTLAIGAVIVSLSAQAMASEAVKTVGGIKAVLRLDTEKSMMDIYLSDALTGKDITDGKVTAVITMPDGEKIEKELMGMKMGASFSFMSSLNMPRKGMYLFDITVDTGKTKIRFKFSQSV